MRNFLLIPQLQFPNLKVTLPQLQFSSPQLESSNSAIFGIFLAMESVNSLKRIRDKKSHATVPLRQVLVSRETKDLKIFLVYFSNHPEMRKRE